MDELKRRLDALQRDEHATKRRRILESLGMGHNAAAFPGVLPNDFAGLIPNAAVLPSSFALPTTRVGLGPGESAVMRQILGSAGRAGFPTSETYRPSTTDSGLTLDSIMAHSRGFPNEDRLSASWNELVRAKQEEAKKDAALFFQHGSGLPTFGGNSIASSLQHRQNQGTSRLIQNTRGHGCFPALSASLMPVGRLHPLECSTIRPDPSGLSITRNSMDERPDLRTNSLVESPSPLDPIAQKKPEHLQPLEKGITGKEPEGLAAGRDFTPLGVEEDINWLSEMHCFLRSEIVEVFHVKNSKLTGRSTSKGLSVNQVGIRCRWCADLPPESRVSRSSAFPSSLRQLYQSFTMMVRDHFGPHTMCTAIPASYRKHLNHLRNTRNSQGASDSKHYWAHAAHKIGMVDTDEGIQITEASKAEGEKMGNFGAPSVAEGIHEAAEKPPPVTLLVKPDDLSKTNMFFYTLLLQTKLVHLQKSELVAKRRTLPQGLEGIGCRHCCAAGRYGFSRRFPLRRRSLPEEVMDMYNHMRRCTLCPNQVKELIQKLHDEYEADKANQGHGTKDGRGKDPHKEFFDILWRRLGRTQDIKT